MGIPVTNFLQKTMTMISIPPVARLLTKELGGTPIVTALISMVSSELKAPVALHGMTATDVLG